MTTQQPWDGKLSILKVGYIKIIEDGGFIPYREVECIGYQWYRKFDKTWNNLEIAESQLKHLESNQPWDIEFDEKFGFIPYLTAEKQFRINGIDETYKDVKQFITSLLLAQQNKIADYLENVTDDFEDIYSKFPANETAIIIKNRIKNALTDSAQAIRAGEFNK